MVLEICNIKQIVYHNHLFGEIDCLCYCFHGCINWNTISGIPLAGSNRTGVE